MSNEIITNSSIQPDRCLNPNIIMVKRFST
jgi:hypothetical protein